MDPTFAGDIVLTIGSIVVATISTYGARQARHARKMGEANAVRIDRVQRQTSSDLDARIRRAVLTVESDHPGLIDQAVATEAIRDLLHALVELNLPAGERPPPTGH